MWSLGIAALVATATAGPPQSLIDDPLWSLVGYDDLNDDEAHAQLGTVRCQVGVGEHCLAGRGVVLHVLLGPELSLSYDCREDWRDYVDRPSDVALPGGLRCGMSRSAVDSRWGTDATDIVDAGWPRQRYTVGELTVDLAYWQDRLYGVFVRYVPRPVELPVAATRDAWLANPLIQLVGLRDTSPEVRALRARLVHQGGPGLPFESPAISYAVFGNGVAIGMDPEAGRFFGAYVLFVPDAPVDHADPFPVPIGWRFGEDSRDVATARVRPPNGERGQMVGPGITRPEGEFRPSVGLTMGRPVDPATSRRVREPRLMGFNLFTAMADGRIVTTRLLDPVAPPPPAQPVLPYVPAYEMLRQVATGTLADSDGRRVKEGVFQPTYAGDLVLGTWLEPGQSMTLYVFVPIEAASRFGIWHPDPTKPTGYWDSTVWSAPEGSLVAVAAAHFLNTTGVTGEHAFRVKYGTYTGPMYYVLETK